MVNMTGDSFICAYCEQILDVSFMFYSELLDDTYCEECGDEAENQLLGDAMESRNDRD